ncbi:MAG: hypothetical protein M1269_08320 [Chloroflexi bacterium]|nr:hypothetical protein [Chloroflexota bacterium]
MSEDRKTDRYAGKIKQQAILFSSGERKPDGEKNTPEKRNKSKKEKPQYITFKSEKPDETESREAPPEREKLYNDGIESAPFFQVAGELTLLLVLILLGFVGLMSAGILFSLLYLIFIAVSFLYFLGRHVCTNCWYYGKVCHCGWGRIARSIHGKTSGDVRKGAMFAIISTAVLIGAPVLGMLTAVAVSPAQRPGVLVFLLIFIMVSAVYILLHIYDCSECKMRFCCPLSLAKKEGSPFPWVKERKERIISQATRAQQLYQRKSNETPRPASYNGSVQFRDSAEPADKKFGARREKMSGEKAPPSEPIKLAPPDSAGMKPGYEEEEFYLEEQLPEYYEAPEEPEFEEMPEEETFPVTVREEVVRFKEPEPVIYEDDLEEEHVLDIIVDSHIPERRSKKPEPEEPPEPSAMERARRDINAPGFKIPKKGGSKFPWG